MFKGTILNTDPDMVRKIKKEIKAHNGFCPNKQERNADTKCPCLDYRQNGYCDCGLYIKDISDMINKMF